MFGRSLSFCFLSFGHCIFCPSSIYDFWLPPFSIFKHFLIAYQFLYFAKAYFFSHIHKSIFCFFQIVHKRLAARNILLDFLLEPKITGFGPDPASVQDNESTSVSHDNSTNLSWSHQPVSHRHSFVPSQRHMSWYFLWLVSEGEGWLFILFILVNITIQAFFS